MRGIAASRTTRGVYLFEMNFFTSVQGSNLSSRYARRIMISHHRARYCSRPSQSLSAAQAITRCFILPVLEYCRRCGFLLLDVIRHSAIEFSEQSIFSLMEIRYITLNVVELLLLFTCNTKLCVRHLLCIAALQVCLYYVAQIFIF